METIVSHSAQLASVYPGSRFLAHIAQRRQAQSAELKVFLADLTRRLTDTTRREVSDGSAHATAAWFDFLDGWMGSIEKELVRPSTLRQTVEGLSPPVATPPPAIQQIFGADHVALRFALSFHVWPRGTILTSSSQCFPRGHRYYQFYLCTARRFAGLGIFSGAL
jgi:hypothetical protein